MRKNNIFFVPAAALMCITLLFSCNVNDEIEDKAVAVRFTAGIDNQAVASTSGGTRAAGSSWAAGDAIGVFMVDNGGGAVVESAANRKYATTTGDGNFNASTPADEIYYPINGSAVKFTACYPRQTGATLGTPITVSVETTQTAANQPAFDLLYATADNSGSGYTKTYSGSVPLVFEHKLAKLVMNTTADASVDAALAGMTVKINGMNTKSTFDLSAGTLGIPGTVAAIVPRTVTDGSAYDAIILPGSYTAGAVTVAFTISTGETFTWTLPATEFKGANEYDYTVTLKRTGVEFTGSIKPWISVNEGPVTAE